MYGKLSTMCAQKKKKRSSLFAFKEKGSENVLKEPISRQPIFKGMPIPFLSACIHPLLKRSFSQKRSEKIQ